MANTHATMLGRVRVCRESGAVSASSGTRCALIDRNNDLMLYDGPVSSCIDSHVVAFAWCQLLDPGIDILVYYHARTRTLRCWAPSSSRAVALLLHDGDPVVMFRVGLCELVVGIGRKLHLVRPCLDRPSDTIRLEHVQRDIVFDGRVLACSRSRAIGLSLQNSVRVLDLRTQTLCDIAEHRIPSDAFTAGVLNNNANRVAVLADGGTAALIVNFGRPRRWRDDRNVVQYRRTRAPQDGVFVQVWVGGTTDVSDDFAVVHSRETDLYHLCRVGSADALLTTLASSRSVISFCHLSSMSQMPVVLIDGQAHAVLSDGVHPALLSLVVAGHRLQTLKHVSCLNLQSHSPTVMQVLLLGIKRRDHLLIAQSLLDLEKGQHLAGCQHLLHHIFTEWTTFSDRYFNALLSTAVDFSSHLIRDYSAELELHDVHRTAAHSITRAVFLHYSRPQSRHSLSASLAHDDSNEAMILKLSGNLELLRQFQSRNVAIRRSVASDPTPTSEPLATRARSVRSRPSHHTDVSMDALLLAVTRTGALSESLLALHRRSGDSIRKCMLNLQGAARLHAYRMLSNDRMAFAGVVVRLLNRMGIAPIPFIVDVAYRTSSSSLRRRLLAFLKSQRSTILQDEVDLLEYMGKLEQAYPSMSYAVVQTCRWTHRLTAQNSGTAANVECGSDSDASDGTESDDEDGGPWWLPLRTGDVTDLLPTADYDNGDPGRFGWQNVVDDAPEVDLVDVPPSGLHPSDSPYLCASLAQVDRWSQQTRALVLLDAGSNIEPSGDVAHCHRLAYAVETCCASRIRHLINEIDLSGAWLDPDGNVHSDNGDTNASIALLRQYHDGNAIQSSAFRALVLDACARRGILLDRDAGARLRTLCQCGALLDRTSPLCLSASSLQFVRYVLDELAVAPDLQRDYKVTFQIADDEGDPLRTGGRTLDAALDLTLRPVRPWDVLTGVRPVHLGNVADVDAFRLSDVSPVDPGASHLDVEYHLQRCAPFRAAALRPVTPQGVVDLAVANLCDPFVLRSCRLLLQLSGSDPAPLDVHIVAAQRIYNGRRLHRDGLRGAGADLRHVVRLFANPSHVATELDRFPLDVDDERLFADALHGADRQERRAVAVPGRRMSVVVTQAASPYSPRPHPPWVVGVHYRLLHGLPIREALCAAWVTAPDGPTLLAWSDQVPVRDAVAAFRATRDRIAAGWHCQLAARLYARLQQQQQQHSSSSDRRALALALFHNDQNWASRVEPVAPPERQTVPVGGSTTPVATSTEVVVGDLLEMTAGLRRHAIWEFETERRRHWTMCLGRISRGDPRLASMFWARLVLPLGDDADRDLLVGHLTDTEVSLLSSGTGSAPRPWMFEPVGSGSPRLLADVVIGRSLGNIQQAMRLEQMYARLQPRGYASWDLDLVRACQTRVLPPAVRAAALEQDPALAKQASVDDDAYASRLLGTLPRLAWFAGPVCQRLHVLHDVQVELGVPASTMTAPSILHCIMRRVRHPGLLPARLQDLAHRCVTLLGNSDADADALVLALLQGAHDVYESALSSSLDESLAYIRLIRSIAPGRSLFPVLSRQLSSSDSLPLWLGLAFAAAIETPTLSFLRDVLQRTNALIGQLVEAGNTAADRIAQVLLLVVDRSPIEHLLSSALSAHRYSLIEHVLQLCPPVDAALDAFLVSWTASRSLHAVIDISRRFKRHSAVGQIFLYQARRRMRTLAPGDTAQVHFCIEAIREAYQSFDAGDHGPGKRACVNLIPLISLGSRLPAVLSLDDESSGSFIAQHADFDEAVVVARAFGYDSDRSDESFAFWKEALQHNVVVHGNAAYLARFQALSGLGPDQVRALLADDRPGEQRR
ncbi:unnamed protein product (mitochondrion) [Plasmodiophora brassicae]|uniref:Spatacsin C-terminal domain-containing protein n=1 Tax=Plasmodiophora brassicae TaxID=37360 RepID=A0A3P3Y8C3_PLABS|nr:unnamed protein product [Plasmodiophora brassicae]